MPSNLRPDATLSHNRIHFPGDYGDEYDAPFGPDDYPIPDESTVSGASSDPDDLEALDD
jgi:hypothetical protein